MKRMLKVSKFFELEQALNACANLTAAKLGYGLARNANIVADIVKVVRERMKGSENYQKYIQKVQSLMSKPGKTPVEREAMLDALKDEMKVQEEMDELEERQKLIFEEEEEVEWRRVSLAQVPGLKDEDDLTKGVLQMGLLRLFMEVGIIYDPADEKDEKKDDKKE